MKNHTDYPANNSRASCRENLAEKMVSEYFQTADNAIRQCIINKDYVLTEKEKFVIARLAGVEVITEYNNETKTWNMTTEPCGVAWDGTKFLVAAEERI